MPLELRGFATAANLVTAPVLHPLLDKTLGRMAEAAAVPAGGSGGRLSSTGRGKAISMTVERRRNAAQVLAQAGIDEEATLQQPFQNQQPGPLQGTTAKLGGLFSTAGGRAILISEQHARRVADMLEFDNAEEAAMAAVVGPQQQPPQSPPQQQQQAGPGGLFATASGRPIHISDQHLQQAAAALELEPMQVRIKILPATQHATVTTAASITILMMCQNC